MTDETRFLAALPIIDDITALVCRRHHLPADEAEEFRSDVRLHFIERNYEVLRRFEGRASLPTYISVIVQRLFLDHRNRRWGRWRPSTEAERLGPTAILLEQLIARDGWPRDQAIDMVRLNHHAPIDDALEAFCDKVAARTPARRFVAEEDAGEIASDGPAADGSVVRAERSFLAKRVHASLRRARQALAPMDRLILKMRFEDRLPIADIARALHLDQRRLYRTVERILEAIRMHLKADGIAKADVDALFEDQNLIWSDELESTTATDAATSEPPEDEGSSWQRG